MSKASAGVIDGPVALESTKFTVIPATLTPGNKNLTTPVLGKRLAKESAAFGSDQTFLKLAQNTASTTCALSGNTTNKQSRRISAQDTAAGTPASAMSTLNTPSSGVAQALFSAGSPTAAKAVSPSSATPTPTKAGKPEESKALKHAVSSPLKERRSRPGRPKGSSTLKHSKTIAGTTETP